MAKAQKLPSGSWRCRATKVIDGKKITKAFIVSPNECRGDSKKAKKLAETRANEWAMTTHDLRIMGMTVEKAIDEYISSRDATTAPSTITTYHQLRQYFDPIKDVYLEDVDNKMLQNIVNDMASRGNVKKTIQNRMRFIFSVLKYEKIKTDFDLTYTKMTKEPRQSPDYEHIIDLLNEADDIIKPVICLAAFSTMRRGEIAALKQKDISRDMRTVYVHATMSRSGNTFVYREITKGGSRRTIDLPKAVIDLLPEDPNPESFVFDLSPTAITRRFERLRNSLGLKCDFHDLRHFAASYRADLNIPKKYTKEAGGWASDVVERIYDNTLKSSRVRYAKIANNYVDDNFGTLIKKRKAN